MMKKLNRWLNEHVSIWPWEEERAGVAHLWALFLTPILMILSCILFTDVTIPFQIIFGLASFAPPIVAGIIALITKKPWEPWYWFPIVAGAALGGILGCLIFVIFF